MNLFEQTVPSNLRLPSGTFITPTAPNYLPTLPLLFLYLHISREDRTTPRRRLLGNFEKHRMPLVLPPTVNPFATNWLTEATCRRLLSILNCLLIAWPKQTSLTGQFPSRDLTIVILCPLLPQTQRCRHLGRTASCLLNLNRFPFLNLPQANFP